MSSPVSVNQWSHLVDTALLGQLDRTEFLTRCRNHTVTREELDEFVVQQFFYSRHFTRYICALLANIADEQDRLELTENLLEEIGFGENGSLPHSQIYRNMMKQMGINPEDHSPTDATHGLIRRMLEACRDTNPLVGLGALCLGAEAIVPYLYSQIVEGFQSQGEPEENLTFFRIHIECDDEHAQTMRRIIERELVKTPGEIGILRLAARRVIEARVDFFDALSPTEGKRNHFIPGGVFYERILV